MRLMYQSLVIANLVLALPGFAIGAEHEKYIEFKDKHLLTGRSIWLNTCESCHGYGIADAPIPMQASDWEMRVTKEKSVLYDHAINGFFGPDDTMMPERGGNAALTDAEVRAAVDYMIALANYYIQMRGK